MLCYVSVLIFSVYKLLLSGALSGQSKARKQPPRDNPTENDIVAKMRSIQDTRPNSCKGKEYNNLPYPSVSVIFSYHNNEFYDLKLTLDSFLRHTPSDRYTEVILMDDGTDIPEIRTEVQLFLAKRKFNSINLLRSPTRDGEAASRFKASKTAKGSVLVFANHNVIFNVGWLEPMVNFVLFNPRTIAMPHVDNYLHGYKFFPLSNKLINVFSLTLSTLHLESPEETPDNGVLMSPVMRGDVFAVVREYYENLGEHDEIFKDGGGHDLELSLRTWLCGGEIKIVLCSRVAIHDALKPQEVHEPQNARRFAELWLGSYKSAVYKQRNDFNPQMSGSESNLLRARTVRLQKNLQCKTIDWYLSNVALDMILPSDDFIHFGKFRVNTGHCLVNNNDMLEMDLCKPMMYQTEMIFEIDVYGKLSNALKCVSALTKDKIALKTCNDVTDNEIWAINNNQQLINRAFDGFCLEYTQSGSPPLELKPCSDKIRGQIWTVVKY